MGPLYEYEVGKLYNPRVTCWPETSQLRLSPKGISLAVFWAGLSEGEVTETRKGAVRFAWVNGAGRRVGLLCFKFGALPWEDTAYEAHREPERGWLDTAVAGKYQLLQVHLVDADTGILRAGKVVTWPPQFAECVWSSVAEQLSVPRDDKAADTEASRLYALGDSEHLAERHSAARCQVLPGIGRE